MLAGNPKDKRVHERLNLRWDKKIQIPLKENIWEDVDWKQLAKERGNLGASCGKSNKISAFIKGGLTRKLLLNF
jgi:hypothetical protein